VLARGIDVATTTMVVNYDIPITKNHEPDCETYLHRIGRSGRYSYLGVSISFVHDYKSWRDLAAIQKYYGVPMSLVPTDDVDV
jgi:ATP-dependent RNA helicase DDX19/DBP5